MSCKFINVQFEEWNKRVQSGSLTEENFLWPILMWNKNYCRPNICLIIIMISELTLHIFPFYTNLLYHNIEPVVQVGLVYVVPIAMTTMCHHLYFKDWIQAYWKDIFTISRPIWKLECTLLLWFS